MWWENSYATRKETKPNCRHWYLFPSHDGIESNLRQNVPFNNRIHTGRWSIVDNGGECNHISTKFWIDSAPKRFALNLAILNHMARSNVSGRQLIWSKFQSSSSRTMIRLTLACLLRDEDMEFRESDTQWAVCRKAQVSTTYGIQMVSRCKIAKLSDSLN